MSRIILSFRYIGSCLLCSWIFFSESQAIETIIVGEAERPWSEGGGGPNTSPPALTPELRLTPRTAGRGNTPGGVIDFEAETGWIVPTQIDPVRNLFQLIREQGGSPSISSPNVSDLSRSELEAALEGTINGSGTVYVRKSTPTKRNVNPLGEHIDIDLGARFGIERIRFYPSPFFPEDFLSAFEIKVNDGTAASLSESGNPLWTQIFREVQNSHSDTNILIPLQFVRYLRLTSLTTVGFEIDEIELYGRGYVPSSRYLSDVFDLGEKQAVWGRIRWSAGAIGDPSRALIAVRTRTGNTPTPLVFTRNVIALSLSAEPSRFEMKRISYDRAIIGLVLAPVELPEQTLAAAEYATLYEELRDWLAGAGARYTALDESGSEQAATRPAYEAAEPERQGPVRLPAVQIDPATYKSLSRPLKDWLEEGGARYFRRANIGENVLYDIDGEPLDATTYNRIPEEERGPILENTEDWSPWSAPYTAVGDGEGIQITSPSPRRYFQFEIRFENEDLESTQRVDFLSFEVSSPPVAQRLVAEIFPRQVEPGQSVEFTYAVRPFLDPASNLGFDNFEVQTPVPIQRLLEIQLLDPDGQIRAEQQFAEEKIDELELPYEKGEFTLVSVEHDRFRVRFPKITTHGSVLKLRFATAVLRFGTTFGGWAFDESAEALPQPAIPGNVAQLGAGDAGNLSGLTVFIKLTGDLLGDVRPLPNPFTPNGDGINDRTEIFYDVLNLTDPTPVVVELYDLSGRRIHTLHTGEILSGRYSVPWDGTDERGQLVPPGLYMFKVKVRADVKKEERLGTIAVVY